MTDRHLYAVIMAGGIGSRLWPRSRKATPKQFLDLLGPRTMLQETVERITPLIPVERVLIVVGQEHTETVRSQVPDLPVDNILVEPGPRGTAPCAGLAAVVLAGRDAEATMAVFPADHRIADAAGFRKAITAADRIAQDGYLVTLGIAPAYPHTGYGYIQRGDLLQGTDAVPAYRVRRFAEKPDAETAQEFVRTGKYYWNGGIFVWKVATILAAIGTHLPKLATELQAVAAAWETPRRGEALASAWSHVPRTTIDYGIMEKAARIAVVPVDIGWDDVGNWATLSRLLEANEQSNVLHGNGRSLLLHTKGSYIYSSDHRLVATIGLEGFVVIDTSDALLICPKEHAEEVRDIVDRLEEEGLEEYL